MDPESTRLAYRPEIDGLRAVAVLLVVAEHLGVPGFAGGYVGVDVFFVISGYLICLHLLRDIEARRFSLLRFYDRRVRRILPAFLAMVVAVNLLGYRFMLPPEMHWAADTEQGALLSMSNMSLMKILSYFAPQSRTNPLLHTWSLGVEEQFYFVFPLLLFALLRWLPRKWVSALLLGLAALSLGEANKWLTRDPAVGFYFAPFRAWELLAGAVLAVGVGYKLRGSWERNTAAAVGLAVILWPGFTYNEWTRFPGWHAVPPVLGAVLIIAAGELGGTLVGAALGWAPIRWVGVISYSLYLWHWPLAVFQTSARIVLPDRFPQWEQKLAVFVASLAVAALSWRFVEQPFRTGSLRRKPWVLYSGVIVVTAGCYGLSGYVFRHTDWVNPGTLTVPSPVGRLYAQAAPTADQMRWQSCFMPGSDFPARFAQSECLGSEAGRQDVLLIGDSHAANLEWGLSKAFPELHVQELAISRCQPTMAHAKWLGTECDAAEKFLYETWIPAHRTTPVILSGRWTEDDLDRIGQTIAWFHQLKIPVTLVGPSVEYTQALPRLIDMARSEHDPEVLNRNRLRWPQDLDVRMKALAARSWHVPYISVFDDLCRSLSAAGHSAYNCPVTADGGVTLGGFPDNGVPFLWDAEHTSTAGSERLAQTMREHHQLP